MTVRDDVWHAVLKLLVQEGEFKIGDLPFDEGKRHTVRRVLREMQEKGWLQRESDMSKTWAAGELARLHLNLDEKADLRLKLQEIESKEITPSEVTEWNSLDDITATFEKRGLKPLPMMNGDKNRVLELAEGEYIALIELDTNKFTTDYKPEPSDPNANLVAAADYESFSLVRRVRDFEDNGQIKHQRLSFEKNQFEDGADNDDTALRKLNEIEYGESLEPIFS